MTLPATLLQFKLTAPRRYRYDGDFTICGQPLAIAQEGGQVGTCGQRPLLCWLCSVHTSSRHRGTTDTVVCRSPSLQGRGTGWSVWDGAVAAAKHLEQLALAGSLPAFDPPSILELGSGTGLAGLAAAVATGLPAVLTDLPEVLPALQRNAEANAQVWQKTGAAPTTAGSCMRYSCTAA